MSSYWHVYVLGMVLMRETNWSFYYYLSLTPAFINAITDRYLSLYFYPVFWIVQDVFLNWSMIPAILNAQQWKKSARLPLSFLICTIALYSSVNDCREVNCGSVDEKTLCCSQNISNFLHQIVCYSFTSCFIVLLLGMSLVRVSGLLCVVCRKACVYLVNYKFSSCMRRTKW